ncbi:hypothetical protein GGQ54_000894 [Naumannella cuiyingiana]|uniref:TIGR01777 family protein n=1 Tax=Naumannella cuiyingiana TaxID=1347891 RepID=A0A7Z0D7J4_9ACTN|nr:hypothetical protein [Naumannella cuiyingiana]
MNTAAPERVAVAGSSGLIGSALVDELTSGGIDVIRLVRRPAAAPGERQWDPRSGWIDGAGLSDADAVVGLSGAGIASGPWTDARRAELRDSRLDPTRTLAAALVDAPRCRTFLCGSAVGFYGSRGDEILTEDQPAGTGFLAGLVTEWEAAAREAPAHVRVVNLRTGHVLAADGGLLGALRVPFRAGLGGRLGSGRQWMPWITAADHARAQRHLLTSELTGPVNLVAPHPVTNAEFTRGLAAALHRPAIVPTPLLPIRAAMGRDFVDELLLASQRAVPQRLSDDGFSFDQTEFRGALATLFP